MPFWSKRKSVEPKVQESSSIETEASSLATELRRPSKPPHKYRNSSPFDQRFGARRQEIKDLSQECVDPGVPVNQLDNDTLREHKVKLNRILELVEDHREDLEQELVSNPRLIEEFPTLPTMLDRYADDAQMRLRLVVHGLEWRQKLGNQYGEGGNG